MSVIRLVIIAVVAVAAVSASEGMCASATNCADCVAMPTCGWCSTNVQYSDGTQGPQCAGFGTGSKPFVCPAIYSTEVCQRGWVCDATSDTCEQSAPGQGTTKAECEASCHNTQHHVYLCDLATHTCSIVPPGTPNSTSKAICLAVCSGKPTPKPGPVAHVYACNTSTWQCQVTTPGHGASKLVCDEQCSANASNYICNYQTGSCVQVPPLTPNSVPLSVCQQQCSGVTPAPIPPNPGPPPEYIGLWRGVEIENNYVICEWDILINNTIAIFTQSINGKATSFSGVPYHIPNSPKLEMWVEVNTGVYSGLTVRTIGDTSGARGPETVFATMAMAAAGKAAPASIATAMTDGTSKVFALEKCIPNEKFCVFTLPSQSFQGKIDAAVKKYANVIKSNSNAKKSAMTGVAKAKATFTDACSQWDASCSTCLSHSLCGWCSVPVQYSDGSQGTQCAGFESANSTSFVCPGHYSTLSCEVGYICTSDLTCVATVPGDGMPYEVCVQTCKATPPPAPVPPQYTCDLTTKQCVPCPAANCPGEMPQNQCEQLCPHPYPGPTPDIIGIWRGVYIQQQYSIGEVDFVFDMSGCTVYKDSVFYFHATIISLGSDVMLFTIDKGANAGHTFGTLYQRAQQDFGMYWQMTMAIGKLDGTFPGDFNTPMYSLGLQEVVLAQCLQAPCVFTPPSSK